ncbi:MAG: 2,3-bisphosphoglycerate-independent phosphoglycerate mutase [bacterium]
MSHISLIILDGWGIAKPNPGNAVSQAKTPFFNELATKYPILTINASGEAVGLPQGIMGNSEVGHLTLGSGRICDQDLQKINKSIEDKTFFKNQALVKAIKHVQDNDSSLHIMGLVSDGRVHSSLDHLKAVLDLAKQNNLIKVYLHCFLDGRDTLRDAGLKFVQEIKDYGIGKIASVSGRFYAMDRDNHWERTVKAYEAIAQGKGENKDDPIQAIKDGYEKENFDEEFIPTVIMENNNPVAIIKDNDAVIFFNYRADRARQLTKAFVLDEFDKFERPDKLNNLLFAGFSLYENDLPIEVAFPDKDINNTLGQILADNNLKQLRIAETEKYAHVTYFFNGGKEEKNKGEDHILIPSPRVDSYATQPEMSANIIADKVVKELDSDKYNFILINFANPDMVGHTGDLKAGIKAIETVDKCLSRVVKKILDKQGVAIIIADHGNAEEMLDLKTNTILKEHTTNPVPFIIVGKEFEGQNLGKTDIPGSDLSVLKPSKGLSDVAPTILKIMNLEQPKEMTGKSLI